MEYRKLTKHQGVYERQSESKRHKGKPDLCYDISYKYDGKKRWEKVGWLSEGYSAKLAAEVRGERLRNIRHGKELPKHKRQPEIDEIAKKYLDWAKENKRSYKNDVTRYHLHLKPSLGNKTIQEISSFDLERLKNDLTKKELKPATVKHVLVLFRQIVNKAVVWGLYKGANPIKGVKLPVIHNQKERFLSYDEAHLLLNELEINSKQLHDMALLSLHCGVRAGEIFNLKGQDTDFNHNQINILDSFKTVQPRKAYMTDAIKEILSKYNVEPDEYIFKNINGDKYTEIPRLFKNVVDPLFNAHVKDTRQRVTFHTLRHTFASWLALQGESLLTIRELLGHKSFAMTMRYSHLMPDEKRRATVMLDKVFSEKRNGNAKELGKSVEGH